MAEWDDLARELDAWRASGRTATLWWRDDDASRATGELERLLDLSEETETPVAVAVVPRDAETGLGQSLERRPLASVLQHGFAHCNHAPPGAGKSELGPGRTLEAMLGELVRGRENLSQFPNFLPVLVPPWNRIDPDLPPRLPGIGLKGISTYKARPAAEPAPGLRCANTHADLIDWPGGRDFVGTGAALDLVVGPLSARRAGRADAGEPTGLLTHHLALDEACWGFLGDFLERTHAHGAASWIGPEEVFGR